MLRCALRTADLRGSCSAVRRSLTRGGVVPCGPRVASATSFVARRVVNGVKGDEGQQRREADPTPPQRPPLQAAYLLSDLGSAIATRQQMHPTPQICYVQMFGAIVQKHGYALPESMLFSEH